MLHQISRLVSLAALGAMFFILFLIQQHGSIIIGEPNKLILASELTLTLLFFGLNAFYIIKGK